MRKIALLLGILAIVMGCESTTTPVNEAVDPELTQPCEDQPELFDYEEDALYLSAPVRIEEGFLAIWRDLIRPFDNSWFIDQLEPGLFEVTREADISGTLFIEWNDSSITEKDLFCHGVRKAVVSRPRRGVAGNLVEVSGTRIETPGTELEINRIEVTADFGTRIYEDPLEMVTFPEDLLHLVAGEEVTVRVYGPPIESIVMLRTPLYNGQFNPIVMQDEGGYFEGTWQAPQFAGIYRAAADVLSHDTIYDPDSAYEGVAWIIPYVVE